MKKYLPLIVLMPVLFFGSCKKIDGGESLPKPLISLDRDEPVYRVKVGEALEIKPAVANAGENPAYRWTIGGEVVGTDPSFTFVGTEAGSVYVTFEVIAGHGQDEIEIRVDVAPLKFPSITLPIPPAGISILAGTEYGFQPEVDNAAETTFLWEIDGIPVSDEKDYTFTESATGSYTVRFTASNEDGTDSVEFTVRVCTAEQMSFGWRFERDEYNVALGRTVFIRPYAVENAFDAVYTWKVDGDDAEARPVETRYSGTPACVFAFTPPSEGTYTVEAVMNNSYISASKTFTVNCCPPEGAYKRPAGGSPSYDRVYEFLAAPGQFINEYNGSYSDYVVKTPEEACSYAEDRLRENAYVSLGAFGGYIVLGFDHSVENDSGYNIRIRGNSFSGSSEPGIVWVMQDENGDGIPNDTWYELKGSEYGNADSWLDYAVTYYRPSSAGQPVDWIDNAGGSGQIDYLVFHRQDYYYPEWVEADSYTLVGRRLEPRTEMVSANYWLNNDYEWGYADNFSSVDRLTDDGNPSANVNANHFRISDAVRYDGQPANLAYIDFVKVQTGVQSKAGWLGEVSTEVFGADDFNMIKTATP